MLTDEFSAQPNQDNRVYEKIFKNAPTTIELMPFELMPFFLLAGITANLYRNDCRTHVIYFGYIMS